MRDVKTLAAAQCALTNPLDHLLSTELWLDPSNVSCGPSPGRESAAVATQDNPYRHGWFQSINSHHHAISSVTTAVTQYN